MGSHGKAEFHPSYNGKPLDGTEEAVAQSVFVVLFSSIALLISREQAEWGQEWGQGDGLEGDRSSPDGRPWRPDLDGHGGGGEKWSHLGSTLKRGPTGLTSGLDGARERDQG